MKKSLFWNDIIYRRTQSVHTDSNDYIKVFSDVLESHVPLQRGKVEQEAGGGGKSAKPKNGCSMLFIEKLANLSSYSLGGLIPL